MPSSVGAEVARYLRDLNKRMFGKQRLSQRMRSRRTTSGEDFADFECFFMCVDCGYLATHSGDCPHCGGQNLIDLRNGSLASYVDSGGKRIQSARNLLDQNWAELAAIVLSLGAGFALFFELRNNGEFIFAQLIPLLLATTLGALYRIFKNRQWDNTPLPSRRWRHGLLPTTRRVEKLPAAKVQTTGESIAILGTRRDCVGFRLVVCQQNGKKSEVLLDETRSVDFQLDGRSLYKDRIVLRQDLVEYSSEELSSTKELQRYLRRRGVMAEIEQLSFHLAILSEGDSVLACVYDNGTSEILPVISDGAEKGKLALTAYDGELSITDDGSLEVVSL